MNGTDKRLCFLVGAAPVNAFTAAFLNHERFAYFFAAIFAAALITLLIRAWIQGRETERGINRWQMPTEADRRRGTKLEAMDDY